MNQTKNQKILKKYSSGSIIKSEDRSTIYKLVSVGLMRLGFTSVDGVETETARTLPIGISMYKRETIMRNPIKRFFYYIIHASG